MRSLSSKITKLPKSIRDILRCLRQASTRFNAWLPRRRRAIGPKPRMSSLSSALLNIPSTLYQRNAHRLLSRRLCTPSFAELFRKSVDSAPLAAGDVLHGHVVGTVHPRSMASRFYLVDFGLKTEAPFTSREVPTLSSIGDNVSMPLLQMEDDFNEPVADPNGASQLPAIQAERYALLLRSSPNNLRLVHGRYVRFNRGGVTAKILGVDAFVPRHHVLALERPVLGTFIPFYVLSINADRVSADVSNNNIPAMVDVHPVVSSYGGVLFCLANLVGSDEAWEKSGGGSTKDRLAYLRLLTRILQQKNYAVRRIFPRSPSASTAKGPRPVWRKARRAGESDGDTAWLHELPRGKQTSADRRIPNSDVRKSSAQQATRFRRPTVSGSSSGTWNWPNKTNGGDGKE